MGKIQKLFVRRSLKTSFAQYMIFCILSALLLSLVLSNICQFGQSLLYKKYASNYNTPYGTEISYTPHNSVYLFTVDITKEFNPAELAVYDILGVLSVGVYPLCFIMAIIITSILFYKRQLQIPLTILNAATDNIAENNLDFKITYDKDDELGKLCVSFEKMRIALRNNNLEMWRQVEERKRLNVAFSHDLRTPLTVLKGQSEMLAKYTPQMSKEKITSTAVMMRRHIIRLENYANTINDLQRLEDIEINKQAINPNDAIKQISATGKTICDDKEFILSDNIAGIDKIMLDFGVVMRVFENLLSNAVRFAEEKVTASLRVEKDYFYFIVSDDGKGFSDQDIADATKPFYKAVKETDNEHFGMGLNICKILCEKHGGYLKLTNNKGAVVTAVFDSREQ